MKLLAILLFLLAPAPASAHETGFPHTHGATVANGATVPGNVTVHGATVTHGKIVTGGGTVVHGATVANIPDSPTVTHGKTVPNGRTVLHSATVAHSPPVPVGLTVVSTTGIVNDIVANVGGGRVKAKSLMGSGIDPHLYRATAGDIKTLASAGVIFYHGLHLEGKIADVLEGMSRRGKNTVAVTRDIPREMLIRAGGEAYDPHVWFDPHLWKIAVQTVAAALAAVDPEGADYYSENARAYARSLAEIDGYARKMAEKVPPSQRVIVTSHDAFGYFGRAYGFKVAALQGVSTVSEAAISDMRRVVNLIVTNRLPAVFTETSVSDRYINAVRAAAKNAGVSVAIGGKLYSDAPGAEGSGHGSLAGMFRHNVDVICSALSARNLTGAGAGAAVPARF